MSRRRLWLRLLLVAVVAAILGGAWQGGVFGHLADPAALARWLAATGWRGQVAFLLAYAVLQPFGAPGSVFVFAAPLVWPWHEAFVLSMAGTMAASVVGFSSARFLARDWYAARLPKRLRKYDQLVAEQPFAAVFMLRLLLWMPQALHAFLGVSRVTFATHFWASLLGYVPPLLGVSYLGGDMLAPDGSWQLKPMLLLSGWLVMCAAIAEVLRRGALRGREASAPGR